MFEWEQPEAVDSQHPLIAKEGKTSGSGGGTGTGLLTVLDATGETDVVGWFAAWSARTIGADLDPSAERTWFAVQFTYFRKLSESAMVSIGVTSAPRDKLSVIGAARYGTNDTEFVLSTGPRRNFDLYAFRSARSIGMAGFSNGTAVTPLLSLTPRATAVEERRDPTGSGFLCPPPAIMVVGVVCDLARNSLVFYVNDRIVQTTRIALNPRDKSPPAKADPSPSPFEWTLCEPQQLRECRVYLTMWNAYLKAEFIEWTPPPPTTTTTTTTTTTAASGVSTPITSYRCEQQTRKPDIC